MSWLVQNHLPCPGPVGSTMPEHAAGEPANKAPMATAEHAHHDGMEGDAGAVRAPASSTTGFQRVKFTRASPLPTPDPEQDVVATIADKCSEFIQLFRLPLSAVAALWSLVAFICSLPKVPNFACLRLSNGYFFLKKILQYLFIYLFIYLFFQDGAAQDDAVPG